MATDWLADLEDELSDVMGNVKNKPVPVKQFQNKNNWMPIAVAILLCVFVFWAYKHKTNKVPVQQPAQIQAQLTVQQQLDELKAWRKKDLAKITLQGILFNQNMAQINKIHPVPGIIYIEGDWTIKRMPDNVSLTPADETFLRQYLKP